MSLIIPPSSDGGLTVDVTLAAQDNDVNVNVTNATLDVNATIVGQTTDVDVQVKNQLVNIPRGQVAGASQIAVFGQVNLSGSTTNQIIWSNGAYSLPPPAGVQMSVVSTSAQDGVAGTGIRSIRIFYLDDTLVPHYEDVTMNGLTPVLTGATNIRFITKVIALTYGSGKSAAGNISVYNGATTYAYMIIGEVSDHSSVFMVPAGKRLMITGLSAGASSGSSDAKVLVHIAATVYNGVDYTADSVFVPLAGVALQDNSQSISLSVPFAVEAGNAFGMLVTSDKAAVVVGSYFGWLENA